MNVLLTFTGFHNPYAVGLVGQEEQPGPILSLVGAKLFNRIILIWFNDRNLKSCRIYLPAAATINDETQKLAELARWAAEKLVQLKRVFAPIICEQL